MISEAAKELKKNTVIMTATFRRYDLEVLNITYRQISEENEDCTLILELECTEGDSPAEEVCVRINLYDGGGDMFYDTEYYIDADEVSSYMVCKVELKNSARTLSKAKSARIYMTGAW